MAGGYYNPGYVNPSLYQPSPFMYPGYQQVAYSPYTLPLLGQQYFGNRMSVSCQLTIIFNFTSHFIR